MKRIFSLLLALVLLGSTCLLFAACAGAKEIDLDGYTLIYSRDVSDDLSSKITSFAATLGDAVGVRIKQTGVKADAAAEAGEPYEILVGNTNRPETEKALKKIKGHGYIITVIDGKIVIVGTTNLLTGMALDAFVTKYCASRAASSVLAVETTRVQKIKMVYLTKDWRFVYSSRLDDVTSTNGETWDENPNGYDYPVVLINQLKSELANHTGLKAVQFQMYADKEARSANVAGEILVGITTRLASVDFVAALENVNKYGVAVYEDTVVLAGAGDVTLREAGRYFKDILKDSVAVLDDGTTGVALPLNFTSIKTYTSEWVTDFPKPTGEGIQLSGSVDVADGAVEYYYTGAGITPAAFEAYCQKLAASGYRVYMENTVEDTVFRTYVNNDLKTTLNVTYCAYKHAAAQGVTYYVPALRIVSASIADARINLIPEEMLVLDSGYTKVTDTMITAVRLDYANGSYGNCYIVTLEDGSYIIYDSGFGGTENNKILSDALEALHKKVWGVEPSSTNKMHVRAWYLSHGHGDHYSNFYQLAKSNKGKIKFDYIITNFPSSTQSYNCYNPNLTLSNNLESFLKTMSGTTYLKVHSGQQFYIGNVHFEVLYTHEDIYPEIIHMYNDSSVALRTTVYHTDGQGNVTAGSVPLTTLWLGDTQKGGSACMRATYGSYLKSDQVQIAHHGGEGCELELYQLVKPTCVWYPHKRESYETVMQEGKTSSKNSSRYISYHTVTMGTVSYIIISDFYNVTLTVTRNGANYGLASDENPSGLWNASVINANRKIVYNTGYVIKR